MRSTRKYLGLALAFITFAAAAAVGQTGGIWLSGTIYGEKANAPFDMSLTRDGSSLSGSYYYLRSGPMNKLTLRGVIAGDGSFTMQEFDSTGKQTGEFKGKWNEDPNEPGVTLEGDWKRTGAKESVTFTAEQQMVYLAGDAHFATREMKETIAIKRTDMSAEYPELVGPAGAAGLNLLVKNRVMKSFADFRKFMAGFTAADIKGEPADMRNYLDVGYTVEYADNDLISLSFGEDTFAGGAHPNHDFFTINYDLKAGRQLALADLFKPRTNYLKTIAEYCAKDLQARKDPDTGEKLDFATDIFADGVKPTADNFQDWAITRKGLLILFPPYQVAAYAYGPQSVIVPYSALKGIAVSDGALAKATR
jgi:hypothetical protein